MKQDPRQFWDWFSRHADQYRFLEIASEQRKAVMLEVLRDHLQKYCDKLFFEIGGQGGQDPELIITAEGRTDFFETAEELVRSAPRIGKWKFHALIPPRGTDFQIGIDGFSLNVATLWFQPMGHPALPELTGLRVCIPHFELMKTKEWLQPVVAKMVEYILGEKVYALDIHYIEVGDLPEVPAEMGLFPLPGLTKFLTWRKQRAQEQIRNN